VLELREDERGFGDVADRRVAMIGAVLRPEVPYASADDGVTIAYSVVSAGPVTIVVVSPLISQLEPEKSLPWSVSGAVLRRMHEWCCPADWGGTAGPFGGGWPDLAALAPRRQPSLTALGPLHDRTGMVRHQHRKAMTILV
jgi:hypothetical protein